MTRRVTLREIAHARAGDKGNRSNVSVFVYDQADFEPLARALTPALVEAHLGAIARGGVRRYDLPGLGGFNFVIDEALEGGVNASLNLDGHGKSWSALLLGLELELS